MSINLVRFFCYITVQVIFGTWSKGMKQWGNILDTVVRKVFLEDVARDLNEIWDCSLQRSEG